MQSSKISLLLSTWLPTKQIMKHSIDLSKDDAESVGKKRRVQFSNIGSANTPNSTELMKQTEVHQFENPINQSRFEAFKRCTFASDAVSNFIACCLLHASEQSYHRRINNLNLIGGSGSSLFGKNESHDTTSSGDKDNKEDKKETHNQGADSAKKDQNNLNLVKQPKSAPHSVLLAYSQYHHVNEQNAPQLADLVAPGAASKITSVVITLAKINAQRLIRSARAIATAEGYSEDQKILPRHLMEAHRVRTQYMNGFFMQPPLNQPKGVSHSTGVRSASLDSNFAAALGKLDKNQIQYQAALEAQTIYDEIMSQCKESSIKGKDKEEFDSMEEDKVLDSSNKVEE